ncbi:hypothetical protein AaE_012549 [Aphanomyces astaci]|uniref:Uncharacterized protein n=1 Tax=Aphanomyces astaci TaxID=112090 RepID=A0A6A4ZFD2_APHAT|nr:hypothetical protein AaE_012549 [Aphanomyces astaci]
MSDTYIGDKDLWEVVTNSVATARAANQSVVVADVWASVRCIITNRFQRASALGDNRSAAIILTRTQLAAVTHAVAAPAPPPQAITQADGSVHVMNAFTIPSYAHRDCVNHPGKSCFHCSVANHTLPVCPTLKSDYARNTMCPSFDRTVFDKHGSASQKKRKRDGLVATRALVANMDGDQDLLVPDNNRDRDRSGDRQRNQSYGRTHCGGRNDQVGIAARAAARPFIYEGNRLNGFANTHILSHHFVPPSTLNRVLQRPNPPSVLPKAFQPGSAPLCDVFASPPLEPPLITATTLAPITVHRASSLITSHLLWMPVT